MHKTSPFSQNRDGGVFMIQLTQKERTLLEDQKKHEQICIEKYTNYANQTQSPQLKQLFQSYAAQEQNHYDTVNQILSGQVPNLNQSQQQASGQQQIAANASQSATNMLRYFSFAVLSTFWGRNHQSDYPGNKPDGARGF